MPLPGAGRVEFGQASANAMSMKWSALHEAAGIVAGLAGLEVEAPKPAQRNFPAMMRDAGGWRLAVAEQGVDDLAAIMESGLAALLGLNARGANPLAAALALWQEFHAARAALLDLVPPAPAPAPSPHRFA
jgi:hypothetical protein